MPKAKLMVVFSIRKSSFVKSSIRSSIVPLLFLHKVTFLAPGRVRWNRSVRLVRLIHSSFHTDTVSSSITGVGWMPMAPSSWSLRII